MRVGSSSADVLQAKLTVNQPGDEHEREADHVSAQVMRMPEPQIQRDCACGGTCDSCRGKRSGLKPEHAQTKPAGGSGFAGTEAPAAVHDVLQAPGQPLDAGTRSFMEPRFGHDFSQVRMHTDPHAAASASAVNARAYTVGRDVVFGPGQYAPHTGAGRQLLAHELAHVVQQQESGFAVQRQTGHPTATTTPATTPGTATAGPGSTTTAPATAKDQTEYVNDTIHFLERSADFYRSVKDVSASTFDRVLNSWYAMVAGKQGQEAIIDKDLHGNATLKAGLHAAYISALRILVSKHAATSKQREADLYRINSGRIPPWALPHPSHLEPGVTTPVPDDVPVTRQRGGNFQFSLNGFGVTIQPDTRVPVQAKPGVTHSKIHFGGIRAHFHGTPGHMMATSFTGPPTPVVTVFTSFRRGVNTADTSAYGRGTTAEDKAGAKVTPESGSLGFHESRHGQATLDFLRSNPPPAFTGKVGDTLAVFQAAMDSWNAAVKAYIASMDSADTNQVHCVGFTIDQFNLANGQPGHQIVKECP